MHYKNGRAAKIGDVVVSLDPNNPKTGVVYSISPTEYVKIGNISPCDPEVFAFNCLHVDDVRALAATQAYLPTQAPNNQN